MKIIYFLFETYFHFINWLLFSLTKLFSFYFLLFLSLFWIKNIYRHFLHVTHFDYTKRHFLTFYYTYRHFLHVTHFVVGQQQIMDNFAHNKNDTCGHSSNMWMGNLWTGDGWFVDGWCVVGLFMDVWCVDECWVICGHAMLMCL